MKKNYLPLILLLITGFTLKATEHKKGKSITKSAEKVMKQQRENLYESLEEKVFRAPLGTKSKLQATEEAFKVGKERMYYLQKEEEQIRALETELGMEPVEHDFLTEKYDTVMEEFSTTKNEIEALELENKMLKDYLSRLNAMEARAKGGKR